MGAHLLSLVAISTWLFISISQAELCNPQDRKALVQIRKSFRLPSSTRWLNATDCCTLQILECDPKTRRVISLNIFANDLSGEIPPAIGDLTYLQSLDFHKLPNIRGPIPQELAKLKHLTFLRLDWLNLTGPIPSFLGQLKELYYISLEFNKLSGSIPGELGSLSNLAALLLSRNKLSGSIPSALGYLPGNTSLRIDFSHNQLTGEIPASFNNFNPISIDLSRNQLEGDASMLFGPNKTVQTINLNRNQLEFNLSAAVFPSGLTSLDIDHNKIYGSLPPQLTEQTLYSFNVSYNRLCGEIPDGGDLQNFDAYNYLHNKCLCGAPLPACK